MDGTASNASRRKLFLLEDSPGEAQLFQEALQRAWPLLNTHDPLPFLACAHTAEKALEHLMQEAKEVDVPDLILVDIDLPANTAFSFLSALQRDARLSAVPRIVMGWTDETHEWWKRFGVSQYVTKPVTFVKLVALVKDLSQVWLIDTRRPA
jgi:CheY-like chemotaxis protein